MYILFIYIRELICRNHHFDHTSQYTAFFLSSGQHFNEGANSSLIPLQENQVLALALSGRVSYPVVTWCNICLGEQQEQAVAGGWWVGVGTRRTSCSWSDVEWAVVFFFFFGVFNEINIKM